MSFSVSGVKRQCVSPSMKELVKINFQKISQDYFKKILGNLNNQDKRKFLLDRWYNDKSPGIIRSVSYPERLKDLF